MPDSLSVGAAWLDSAGLISFYCMCLQGGLLNSLILFLGKWRESGERTVVVDMTAILCLLETRRIGLGMWLSQ